MDPKKFDSEDPFKRFYSHLELAILSYGSSFDLTLASQKFTGSTLAENKHAQCAVLWYFTSEGKVNIYLSPRGSGDSKDWFWNFLSIFFRRRWVKGLPKSSTLSVGWANQANLLIPDLVRLLNTFNPIGKIFIVGHSLGATTSVALTCHLKRLGFPVASCYMLESPRFGNENASYYVDNLFKYGLNENSNEVHMDILSVVNSVNGESDMITRWPLKRMGNRHVAREQTIILNSQSTGQIKSLHWGREAWNNYRANNKVDVLPAFRFITRRLRSIQAHRLSVLKKLVDNDSQIFYDFIEALNSNSEEKVVHSDLR